MSVLYKIKNHKTNRVYVGSTTNFVKRKENHLSALKSKSHHSYKLQADWLKYSDTDFSFYIVKDLGNVSTQELLKQEEDLIKKQNNPYNVHLTPYSKPYSPSTKQSKEIKKKKRKFRHRRKQVVREMTKDLPVNLTHNEKVRYHLDALKALGVKLKVAD